MNKEHCMTSFNPLAKVLATITLVAGNAAMAQSLDKPFTVVEPEQSSGRMQAKA